MGAIPLMRFFRLSDGGVQCGEDGLFVGSTPILRRSPRPGGGASWAVRPSDELDRDLSARYGLPIDVAAKREGLAGVARALERGEMPLAKIAALLLRFPDPPSLAKDAPERGSLELAARLFESSLLKGDWDPAKHPRTGTAPNPGRFAVNPDKGELTTPSELAPKPSAQGEPAPGGPWRDALRAAREILKLAGKEAVKTGRLALWLNPELKVAIEATLEIMTSSDLNSREQQAIDTTNASFDPPKTLEELQRPPVQNVRGYDRHHIVEQNPDNIAKSPIEIVIEKFGRDVIEDPSNIAWAPRLKHELVTGYYNSTDDSDPGWRIRRRVVDDLDFEGQREAGLKALRIFGVLK